MERDRFLSRVASAARRARHLEHSADDPGLLVPALADGDLVELFRSAATAADAVVHDAAPVAVITEVAERIGAHDYLSWDPEELPDPRILDSLRERGLASMPSSVPAGAASRLDHQAGYEPVLLGVTGAEAGLAESGSVVLRSGPGRPRMASLIPLVHVVLLETSAIHRSLAHWADRHADSMRNAANVVFVTGPSRTGDIEMKLTKGVHGPKEVHIVLL